MNIKLKAALRDYMNGMKYKDIATKYGVSINTVKSWKRRYKWNRDSRAIDNLLFDESISCEEVKQIINNDDLTNKQKLFCVYYISCFNATKAYRKAYGCSYETALTNGPSLLRNTRIKEEVQLLIKNKFNRAMLSEDDIFQKYIDIAFSDISDYLKFGKKYSRCWGKDEEGNDIPVIDPETGRQKVIDYSYVELIDDVYENDTSIISEISQGKDGIKIKLEDKMKALQWLSEHVDLLTTAQQEKLKLERKAMELKERVVDNEVF